MIIAPVCAMFSQNLSFVEYNSTGINNTFLICLQLAVPGKEKIYICYRSTI